MLPPRHRCLRAMPGFAHELRSFCENTTVRGVPRLVRSTESFPRAVWSVAVVTCSVMLVALLAVLFQKFSSWPVSTRNGEDAGERIAFPDVTVCSLTRFLNDLNETESLEKYFDVVSDRMKLNENNHSYGFLNSLSGFIVNSRKHVVRDKPDCPEFISECTLYYENWQIGPGCKDDFEVHWNGDYSTCRTLRTSTLKVDDNRFTRGVTLVLNNGKENEVQLPYKSSLSTSMISGAMVAVHSPGTLPDMKTGFAVGTGTETVVKIVQTKIQRLDVPHNNNGCTNQRTLAESPSYAYDLDSCLEHCLQKKVNRSCGCTAHWLGLPDSLEEAPTCGNLTGALDQEALEMREFQMWCSLIISLVEDRCKECKQPCEETTYRYTVSSAPWPPLGFQLGVYRSYVRDCIEDFPEVKERYAAYDYFDRIQDGMNHRNFGQSFKLNDLKQIGESFISLKLVIESDNPFLLQDTPQYTWDVMIGLIGGMLSLWLGISAITFFEIFELLYRLVRSCFR